MIVVVPSSLSIIVILLPYFSNNAAFASSVSLKLAGIVSVTVAFVAKVFLIELAILENALFNSSVSVAEYAYVFSSVSGEAIWFVKKYAISPALSPNPIA